MACDFLDFLGPTRKALLLAIKEQPGVTAAELAEITFLSIAATRAHLLVLERAGLINYRRRRDGVGRPAHVYSLTEAGEAIFPQAYATLANTLIEFAEQHPECSNLLWISLEEQQRAILASSVTALEPARRVQQVADALAHQGYAPELRAAGESRWELTMRHCPILTVAREHPRFCDLERRLIAGAVGGGATVRHRWRRPGGDPVCVATITGPS